MLVEQVICSNEEIVVLGIDPGTVITGYGIVKASKKRVFLPITYGIIRPKASLSLSERYRIIFQDLEKLIETYSPQALSIETQFVDKNPQTAIKLGMARGVAVLAASLKNIPIFEYTPSRAKAAVTGSGKADKQQVKMMVTRLLGLSQAPEGPEDITDALALALCYAYSWTAGKTDYHCL
ncbi:Crossover junction endodeoxyribonuclease RuvC [Candidatus Clavichlamydia salmonicola]|uniref:crossover junction endodeoxyribonuclease RuvC n=1 Tax=Candidatus Clavichlamydia salmonicola TaxID=469812 RepID=UPI001E55721F|nr:crossover junction endodeoxyribonuclease RuvC [Candidatus Clavichlamydia salmonicola]MBF5050976.1 Crossover junction endodeoxyribonuclease RuvC [Candidatus Clavichlamydia salmonicola]